MKTSKPMSQRLTLTLSDYAVRKIICWSKIHDKTKTAYAAQIIEARVEANAEKIDTIMQDIADFEGIEVKELEKRWLDSEGYKPDSDN